jgi:hypothetical protein
MGYTLRTAGVAAALLPVAVLLSAAGGDSLIDALEHESIRYIKSTATDPVAKLQQRVDAGQVQLRFDAETGYLRGVLQALGIPLSSQTLVFAKTSLQRERISPSNPRAIYFNDSTYVGWVPGGPVLEISTTDPKLGATFYVLDNRPSPRPKFIRQVYECLQCHGGSMTMGVPGHIMRSVYAARDGQPDLRAGSYLTSDESPLTERFGGWYATGTHGPMRHMANAFAHVSDEEVTLNRNDGANITDLKRFFDPSLHLTRHSDIAALMVLQHQAHLHNLITRAGYGTRMAVWDNDMLNRELKRPAGYRSESTASRIRSACEPLVKGLLMSGEAPLTAPISGTSGFANDFSLPGPRDARGRSLRQLDLKTRLLKYPCSWLIYTEGFNGLPADAKDYVFRRLFEVLSGRDRSAPFAHLTTDDRKAVLEILRETKPEFAAYCR